MVLTESIMRRLIKEALEEISIDDKYNLERSKTKWNEDDYKKICLSDPTYNSNKGIVGKYSNWLLRNLQSVDQLEQLYEPLEWYAQAMKRGILQRNNIPTDINVFKTIEDFVEKINDCINANDSDMSQTEYNNRKKLEGQFEILGKNNFYEVIVPNTFEAERYFGSGTKWCTVASEDHFNQYNNKGTLYLFYPKNCDEKYKFQFFLEENMLANYMNETFPDPISCFCSVLGDEEEIMYALISLVKSVFGNYFKDLRYVNLSKIPQALKTKKPEDVFDAVYQEMDGVRIVKLLNKYNFINEKNKLISPNNWFFGVENFCDGTAIVSTNTTKKDKNILNKKGKLLSKFTYHEITRIKLGDNNVFIARIYKSFFLLKDNGRDFNKQAFFSILKVTDNYLIVADEKYFYKINSEGEIVLKYEKSKIPNI